MSQFFYSINSESNKNVYYPVIRFNYKFGKKIKKHEREVKESLLQLQKNLKNEGLKYLNNKKGTKKLSGIKNPVFEFRSKVKGFRFLYKYGWQVKEINFNTDIKDNDIILFDYVSHDEISTGAKLIDESSKKIEDLSDFEAYEVENPLINDDQDFEFTFNLSNYSLIPIFNEEQQLAINDNSKIVIVDGLAGTGKTNICIQIILNNCCKEEDYKILYSTFSENLMIGARQYFSEYYLSVFKRINNHFELYSSIEEIDEELEPYNLKIFNKYTLNEFKDIPIKIINRLQNNIEYKFLIDLYNLKFKTKLKVFDFDDFNSKFREIVKDDLYTKYFYNYNEIPMEIIFKEIEGVLLGKHLESNSGIIPYEDYKLIRKNEQLSEKQLKFIYKICKQYINYINESDVYIDKNLVAQKICEEINLKEIYDLVVLDEVQDFTEKELLAYKHLAKKMFVAGDALQMINPTYFSFETLKNILGKNSFHELNKNYRNTSDINEVIKNLFEVNKNIFGNHGYKIPLSNDENHGSSIYRTKYSSFLRKLNELSADNYTIVVATKEEVETLEKFIDKEVLTISDIKGLEREIIIMYNVLSNHYSKLPNIINTKHADSNSLKRYYFNLFYVGITRAQNHIIIIEENETPEFSEFFEKNFEELEENVNVSELPFELTVLDNDSYVSRITEALKIRKFELAKKYINKINDIELKKLQEIRCNIFENINEENYIKLIDECLKMNLLDDSIFIAEKMNNNDLEEVLKSIKDNHKIDYSICYKVFFNTKSQEIKKLLKNILDTSRENVKSKCNDILQLLEEL